MHLFIWQSYMWMHSMYEFPSVYASIRPSVCLSLQFSENIRNAGTVFLYMRILFSAVFVRFYLFKIVEHVLL